MFKNITYKKKFLVLLLCITLLGFLTYKRSIKGTIESISFYYKASDEILSSSEINEELLTLKMENEQLDLIIGKKAKNPEIVQNYILKFLNTESKNITVSKIENLHVSADDYFTVYSNIVTLKGGFNELLETTYAIESSFEFAKIANLKFYTARNPQTRQMELFNKIIFQNYEKN